MNAHVQLIVDLQYGSTGKGLLAGYLARREKPEVVVSANMPNAGHTFIEANGTEHICKALPNGYVSPDCKWVLIGPGAVTSQEQLIKEVRFARAAGYNQFHVGIHRNAIRLTPEHQLGEADLVDSIGSTAQGSAAALIHKMWRNPGSNPTWGAQEGLDFEGLPIHVLGHEAYIEVLNEADHIQAEGAQGFSLGINERFYPFCTSRDCTPAAFLQAMALPITKFLDVIGTCRLNPIRVGGNSGPCYPDQQEIRWEDLGVKPEKTTVTQRERRVFTFSMEQMRDAIWHCRPNSIFLNFCNYDVSGNNVVVDAVEKGIDAIGLDVMGPTSGKLVNYKGWGPKENDIVEWAV